MAIEIRMTCLGPRTALITRYLLLAPLEASTWTFFPSTQQRQPSDRQIGLHFCDPDGLFLDSEADSIFPWSVVRPILLSNKRPSHNIYTGHVAK